jgi:hypothetical protein
MQSFENIEDFKVLIKNLIESTNNDDLNNALMIVDALISHDKKEVVASSLGNLYVLIHDKAIRELIINELNEMQCDDKLSIRKSAENSLDTITGEINKYEVLDYGYNILNHIVSRLDNYNYFKSYIPINHNHLSKLNAIKSRIVNSRFTVSWDNMMYNLLKIMLVIDNDLDIFQMNRVDVDDYYQNNFDQAFNIPYHELSQIEITEESPLDTLSMLYAMTYREKGSISHLLGLLDDDNYKIRNMAIAGLFKTLKGLSHFQQYSPDNNLINKVFRKISPARSENRISANYASK